MPDRRMPSAFAAAVAAGMLAVSALSAADRVPAARPLPGAESHLDLAYLPAERYTGDDGPRKDHQLRLNLYLPPQGGPCPLVLLVHGGGYGEGDKDRSEPGVPFQSFCTRIVARGFACGSLNYLLRPKDIFPQTIHDAQDALRFLRKEAARYRLDPTRFGAVGFSAGGWLMSAVGFAHGDLMLSSMKAGFPIAEIADGKLGAPWRVRIVEDGFLFPAWSAEPAWPGQYGQLQAISYDFAHFRKAVHAASPAVNRWVGADFAPEEAATFAAVGVTFDLSVLTDAKHRGRGVHVPGLDSPCRSADGDGEVPLEERILQFFDRELGPDARTPVPEIRPGLRIFDREVVVELLAPDPAIAIRYTTDGSTPTAASQRYAGAFTLRERTVVKASATMPGRRDSGVATATFIPGPVPPRITSPSGTRLPEAEAGAPYRVRFASDSNGPLRWRLAGEIAPSNRTKEGEPIHPLGLRLDPDTGELSGVPAGGGTFWVQVQAARGLGMPGSLRNYLLTVRGAPAGAGATPAPGEDTHVEVARLEGWAAPRIEALMAALAAAGCTPVQQADGTSVMLLVPAAESAAARAIVERARR